MRSDRVRSVLYLPASNARAIEKARTLDCDVAVLDLEDAVAPRPRPMRAPPPSRRFAAAGSGRAWACGSMAWTPNGGWTIWRP